MKYIRFCVRLHVCSYIFKFYTGLLCLTTSDTRFILLLKIPQQQKLKPSSQLLITIF